MGKHKEGNVLLGGMVPPFRKAVTIVTAAVASGNGKPLTQNDLIWMGVASIARQYGVLDENGKVTPMYKDAVIIAEGLVKDTHKSYKGTSGGKRKALR